VEPEIIGGKEMQLTKRERLLTELCGGAIVATVILATLYLIT
jgi:hypothetical protein